MSTQISSFGHNFWAIVWSSLPLGRCRSRQSYGQVHIGVRRGNPDSILSLVDDFSNNKLADLATTLRCLKAWGQPYLEIRSAARLASTLDLRLTLASRCVLCNI